jgi:hypothetical protein
MTKMGLGGIVLALMVGGCAGLLGSSDDRPRASRAQCDYAALHIGELQVGEPLDDDQKQRIQKSEPYATFMSKCQQHSSMSAQCIIDAPSLDQASECK